MLYTDVMLCLAIKLVRILSFVESGGREGEGGVWSSVAVIDSSGHIYLYTISFADILLPEGN